MPFMLPCVSGDTKTALSHLAENALIFEAGGVERGRQEYASHHLGADSAFSQAVPGKVTRRAGEAMGNVAWIATEGRTTGTYKGKAIDQVTTETMVLRRAVAEWKIVHIHWSSASGEMILLGRTVRMIALLAGIAALVSQSVHTGNGSQEAQAERAGGISGR